MTGAEPPDPTSEVSLLPGSRQYALVWAVMGGLAAAVILLAGTVVFLTTRSDATDTASVRPDQVNELSPTRETPVTTTSRDPGDAAREQFVASLRELGVPSSYGDVELKSSGALVCVQFDEEGIEEGLRLNSLDLGRAGHGTRDVVGIITMATLHLCPQHRDELAIVMTDNYLGNSDGSG